MKMSFTNSQQLETPAVNELVAQQHSQKSFYIVPPFDSDCFYAKYALLEMLTLDETQRRPRSAGYNHSPALVGYNCL